MLPGVGVKRGKGREEGGREEIEGEGTAVEGGDRAHLLTQCTKLPWYCFLYLRIQACSCNCLKEKVPFSIWTKSPLVTPSWKKKICPSVLFGVAIIVRDSFNNLCKSQGWGCL